MLLALRKAGLCSRHAFAAQGGDLGFQFFLHLLSFDCPKDLPAKVKGQKRQAGSNKEKATAYEKFGVITTELCPPASQAGRNDAVW
jgi:hypothetical protein